jgi:shikimate kinase
MMKRIFLVGYMGAGKTTIGKALAKQMNLFFVDLDVYIEARYHKTIAQLFEEKGEDGFREIERRVLQEVALFENTLISTGGGTPCFYDNMAFMNATGQTVYLKISPAELLRRLEFARYTRTRPVLNGRSGEELNAFLMENLEKRSVYYMQASVVFDAGRMSSESNLQTITNELEKLLLWGTSEKLER